MNNPTEMNRNSRPLSYTLAELKSAVKDFFETRFAILKCELKQNLEHLEIAAPLLVVGAVLLCTAYLLITAGMIALVAVFIHSAYRWFFAFTGIGLLWAVAAGIAGYIAMREFKLKALAPKKTLEVLKGDKAWLQKEMRSDHGRGSGRDIAA